jgi:hypothetical protein
VILRNEGLTHPIRRDSNLIAVSHDIPAAGRRLSLTFSAWTRRSLRLGGEEDQGFVAMRYNRFEVAR